VIETTLATAKAALLWLLGAKCQQWVMIGMRPIAVRCRHTHHQLDYHKGERLPVELIKRRVSSPSADGSWMGAPSQRLREE